MCVYTHLQDILKVMSVEKKICVLRRKTRASKKKKFALAEGERMEKNSICFFYRDEGRDLLCSLTHVRLYYILGCTLFVFYK